MASNIVLPSLSSWAQSHITALIQSTGSAFDKAFDAFLAENVEVIVVNGEKLTKDQYKQHLQSAKALEEGAEIKYLGTVEAKSSTDGERAGEVGIFLQASIAEKLKVFGASETSTATISFNLKIIQDPSIKPPHLPSGIHGYFDPRRVSALTSVFTEVADPITVPTIVPPATTGTNN